MEQTLTGLAPPIPSSKTEESDPQVDGIDLNWDDSEEDAQASADTSPPNLELKGAPKDTEPDITPSDSEPRLAPLPPAVTSVSADSPPAAAPGTLKFPPPPDDDDDLDDDALTRALPSPDPLEAATVPLPSVIAKVPAPPGAQQPRSAPSSRLPALPALPALVPPSRRPVEPPASRSASGPLPPPTLPSTGPAPLPSFPAQSSPSHIAPASMEPFAPARAPLLESLLQGPKRTFVLAAVGTALALAAIVGILLAIPSGKQGALVVTVSGPGNSLVRTLSVNLDDASRCSSSPCRIEQLPTGTHFVQVSSPNHEPMATRAVQVEPGGETVLHVELMPLKAPAPEARTELASSDSTKPASSPAADFDADAPEARRSASRAAPAAARAAPAAPAKPAVGRLSVNSIPPSSVVIDGQPLGKTPQSKSVAAGSHSIVFIHPTLGRRVQSAQVPPGGARSVVVRFK